MNKCVKFTLEGEIPSDFLQNKLLKIARKYKIEGIAQKLSATSIKIMACGSSQELDDFLDDIHKELATHSVEHFDMIPFLKDRDFRGVFRIIE